MHFLSEKMKSMLQTKQSDQFDTLPLIHEVVVVSGFRGNAFYQIPSSSFRFSQKEVENEDKNIDGLQKKLKWMETDCYSSIKGQWKLFKGKWKVKESQGISNFLMSGNPEWHLQIPPPKYKISPPKATVESYSKLVNKVHLISTAHDGLQDTF